MDLWEVNESNPFKLNTHFRMSHLEMNTIHMIVFISVSFRESIAVLDSLGC